MKIEGVIVSAGYGDFLAWTIPFAKMTLDRLVVVTDTKDSRTSRICEHYHVECLKTDVFYRDGAPFNKAAGINEGLKALSGDDWVIHLDADIALIPKTRSILETLPLDPAGLYSLDRLMCDDFLDWLKFFVDPQPVHEAEIFLHPRPYPVGVRLCGPEHGGWLPLGYFQMWHQGSKRLSYPDTHTSAARTDLQFTKYWGRKDRHMIPELFAIHLETKLPAVSMGANWSGRKTPEFGAEILNGVRVADAVDAAIQAEAEAAVARDYASGTEVQFDVAA